MFVSTCARRRSESDRDLSHRAARSEAAGLGCCLFVGATTMSSSDSCDSSTSGCQTATAKGVWRALQARSARMASEQLRGSGDPSFTMLAKMSNKTGNR